MHPVDQALRAALAENLKVLSLSLSTCVRYNETVMRSVSAIRLNLVVIRSRDIDTSAKFYTLLGLVLHKHRHGHGEEHFATEIDETVFEIYPRTRDVDSTLGTRLGFAVADLDALMEALRDNGTQVISAPKDSPWGRRAVVADPDGHRVELLVRTPGATSTLPATVDVTV